jgi:hypothetical protein
MIDTGKRLSSLRHRQFLLLMTGQKSKAEKEFKDREDHHYDDRSGNDDNGDLVAL